MHNLDVFKLHDIASVENDRLKLSQMIIGNDQQQSDDSDDDKDNKYNLLDPDQDDMIQEEDECAECDDCCGHESSEELPMIKDTMDKSNFARIN